MIEVNVELESDILNISKTTEQFTLFQPKEEGKNISNLFSQRVEHVSNVCRYFKEDIPKLGYKVGIQIGNRLNLNLHQAS